MIACIEAEERARYKGTCASSLGPHARNKHGYAEPRPAAQKGEWLRGAYLLTMRTGSRSKIIVRSVCLVDIVIVSSLYGDSEVYYEEVGWLDNGEKTGTALRIPLLSNCRR